MRKNARIFWVLFGVVILLISLTGCGSSTQLLLSNEEKATLWIVTDPTTSDGMNHLLDLRVTEFRDTHPNVTIQVEVLPAEGSQRAARLQEVREKMEQGEGPDVFLFSTRNVLTLEHPQKYTHIRAEQLIPDVEQAMYEGLFSDISLYYEADSTLGKGALNEAVMEAGTIGKARYVLPLRYDMAVYYVTEEFDTYGIHRKIFTQSLDEWMKTAIATGDQRLACGAEMANSISMYSELINYEKGEVSVSQETLTGYADLYRKVQQLVQEEIRHRSAPGIYAYAAFEQDTFPVQIAALSDALDAAAIANVRGQRLSMYPVRTLEGDVLANVDYYGAVGASCKHADVAYAFLRGFLTEPYQWENLRELPAGEQHPGLLERAFPVRDEDAVEPLWEKLKYQAEGARLVPGAESVVDAIEQVVLTQSDVQVFREEIDVVRFPVTMPEEYWQMLASYDHNAKTAPEVKNADALAASVIGQLQERLG